MEKPWVVCLCGSSRFKELFHQLGYRMERQGKLVLMMAFFQHADNLPVSDEERVVLERVDRYRIDLANEVYFVNKDGYMGPSTMKELAYAEETGKVISFLEPSDE